MTRETPQNDSGTNRSNEAGGDNRHVCRMTGREQGLVGKYNIWLCRQSFRELAPKMGFEKYDWEPNWLTDTPAAGDGDRETIVVVGKESVGKSELVSSLTGDRPTSGNFRGTTTCSERYTTDQYEFVDTPGIVLDTDTEGTGAHWRRSTRTSGVARRSGDGRRRRSQCSTAAGRIPPRSCGRHLLGQS